MVSRRTIKFSAILAVVAIIFDYIIHRTLTSPMETTGYFIAKFLFFFALAIIILTFYPRKGTREFRYVIITGIVVALLWGAYYNILPALIGYTPFGIPLIGLTFLNYTGFMSGLLFGATHVAAWMIGYYTAKRMLRNK